MDSTLNYPVNGAIVGRSMPGVLSALGNQRRLVPIFPGLFFDTSLCRVRLLDGSVRAGTRPLFWIARDENDRSAEALFAQAALQFESVHARHVHVDDQTGRLVDVGRMTRTLPPRQRCGRHGRAIAKGMLLQCGLNSSSSMMQTECTASLLAGRALRVITLGDRKGDACSPAGEGLVPCG